MLFEALGDMCFDKESECVDVWSDCERRVRVVGRQGRAGQAGQGRAGLGGGVLGVVGGAVERADRNLLRQAALNFSLRIHLLMRSCKSTLTETY